MAERLSRPKLTNDEDDIMEMQQQFLAGEIAKSAEMEVLSAPSRDQEGDKKRSIFATKRGKESTAASSKGKNVSFDFTQVQVLKDVVEKIELPSETRFAPDVQPSLPSVFTRNKSLTSSNKTSIFAQQMNAKKAKKDDEESMKVDELTGTGFLVTNLLESSILSKTEAEMIHSENVKKLSSMTKEELQYEKEKLLQSLDPKLISFIHKRAASAPKRVNETPKFNVPKNENKREKLPVNVPQSQKNWVHMDVVEEEKMAWMSPLPPPTPNKGKPFPARFDFEGGLLPYDAELPTTSALYHHGEEPERAGYTINELLILSRSSVLQQRVLALNTLSKILEQNQLGAYDRCFQEPLIPNLLENGLLLMLRYSLDDSNPAVMSAALTVFSHLLCNPLDETCLERCYMWHRGEEQPRLPSQRQLDEADQEEEPEMKDDEVAQVDIVKGCLRIDLLLRIRYIIEKVRPEPRAILAALSVLTRMARHSSETARAILDCPRLMQSIMDAFLPNNWTSLLNANPTTEVTTLYGVPVRQVFRLIRVICSWNLELSQRLTSDNRILDAIISYTAMDVSELNLPTQEGLLLILDSYHTWRVLLQYGIGIQHFTNFYPALMKQLLYYQNSVSMDSNFDPNNSNARFSHQLGAAILLMLESVLRLCCGDESWNVHFVHISGLRKPVETCLRKWLSQLHRQNLELTESICNLLAAALHFLATFFTHWNADSSSESASSLEELCKQFVFPFIRSESLAALSSSAIRYSNLISTLKLSSRDPDSLPAASSTVVGGEAVPLLLPSTPFPLLTAIIRFMNVALRSNHELVSQQPQKVEEILKNLSLEAYLVELSQSACSLAACWFTRYEVHFIYELLMLIVECQPSSAVLSIVHQAALVAVNVVSQGDEYIAARLLIRIVFHPTCVQDASCDLEAALKRMNISQPTYYSLLDKAVNHLSEISAFYVKQLFSGERIAVSEKRTDRTEAIGHKSGLTYDVKCLLPSDWIYLPLLFLYKQYLDKGSSSSTLKASPENILFAIRPLEAAYVFLSLRPGWFFRIDPVEHFCRLACTFLAANDLFLQDDVSGFLWPLLRGLCSNRKPLDFSLPISGLEDFPTFYSQLVDQYEAVSYGNTLFGVFLLLPLQQRQDVKYRLKLWCEHPTVIRILSVTEEQLPCHISYWLEPTETDPVLRMKYASCIRTGVVHPQRNPVLWQIAQNHSMKEGLNQ